MAFDPIKAGNLKAEEIDKLLSSFEALIDQAANLLNQGLVDGFLSKLDTSNGLVLSTEQNLRKLALIDKYYSEFQKVHEVKVITSMISHMDEIMALNDQYFTQLNGGRKVSSDDIKGVLRARLGINADGSLIRQGYMMGLLDDPQVRNEIRNYATTKLIGGAGFQDFRAGLRDLVAGDPDRLGIFKRFYRNYAFDTYAQTDATNGKLYAEKLGLKYFIYNGGIMRDRKGKVKSRKFCIHRAGKVFSSAEAAKWKDDKELTAVDDKSTYSWQIQRGGFGCRHSIDYISEELAFQLRPELAAQKGQEPEPTPPAEVPPAQPKAKVARQKLDRPAKTAWADIPDLVIRDAGAEIPEIKAMLKERRALGIKMDGLRDEVAALTKKVSELHGNSTLSIDEIRAQLQEIKAQRDIVAGAIKEAQAGIDEMAAKARASLIQEQKSGITITNPYAKKSAYTVLNKNINEAAEFYRGFVGAGINDGVTIQVQARDKARAFYRDIEKKIMLGKYESTNTIVHELAHNTEYENNWILKRSVDFLRKRTANGKQLFFSKLERYKGFGYRADEKFLEDKFFSDYCGKLYEATLGRSYDGLRCTEIVSMGVEMMYKDPVGFYDMDPEYFNFIYSLFTE